MINKAEQKRKQKYKENATQTISTRVIDNERRGAYLTNHAYNIVEEELKLSKLYHGYKENNSLFYVYTPDK